jgi:hypothetical protein
VPILVCSDQLMPSAVLKPSRDFEGAYSLLEPAMAALHPVVDEQLGECTLLPGEGAVITNRSLDDWISHSTAG